MDTLGGVSGEKGREGTSTEQTLSPASPILCAIHLWISKMSSSWRVMISHVTVRCKREMEITRARVRATPTVKVGGVRVF